LECHRATIPARATLSDQAKDLGQAASRMAMDPAKPRGR